MFPCVELEKFMLNEEKPFLLKFLIKYKFQLMQEFKCPKSLRKDILNCFEELWLKHNFNRKQFGQYNKVDVYVWDCILESPEEPTSEEDTTMVTVASRSKKASPGVCVLDAKIKHIDQYSLSDIGDGVLIPGVEVKPQFTNYRASSLACVKKHSFTNQQLLSLSNIVFLSPSCRTEFLDTPTSESVYATLTAPLFSSLPSLSAGSLSPIQNAFTSFSANHDTVLFSQTLLEHAKNSNDSILKSILLSFLTLVCEVTDPSVPAMSEMHIQSSFVHPLIRGITKSSPSIIPHCSNKTAFVKGHNILHCRPDYRVDVYGSAGVCHGTGMFGELKPEESSVVDVTSDFHKCMILGKLALQYGSSPYIMTFYTH
ncbi:hypothetical protein CU098_007195, partial [Rhizopus stolonifer]